MKLVFSVYPPIHDEEFKKQIDYRAANVQAKMRSSAGRFGTTVTR
jgi:hypothetical protein